MTTTTRTRAVRTALLDPRSDADLLSAFLTRHDHEAFAALVHRHGPLVLGVCRRALGPTADADDAFQATFLVLVKRAAAIPWRANLGPWLFGVAHRIAAKARFRRNRRFALEKQVDAMPHPETTSTDPDDLSRLFDEELAKLPEEMRRAVVLCELQGLSRAAAAKQLQISEGTLSSRLGRARKKLAVAFTARGVTLAVPAAVGVSTVLTTTTVRAAADPTGAVPAGVTFLVQEALKAMTVSKLKIGAVLAAVAVGCTLFGLNARGGDDKSAKKTEPTTAEAKPADKPKPNAVATVNGEDIQRDEFGEYLISKYGAKEIEGFVNKKVIEQAAAKANVRVSEKEIDAELDADAKGITVSLDDFVRVLLPKYGKTLPEWRDDILLPRLILAKLGGKVEVTDDELKRAFETKYGEQRRIEFVNWGEKSADRPPGAVKPIGRYTSDEGAQALHDAIFKLKLKETSEPVVTKQGTVTVSLAEIIPPRTDKKFEDEKAALKAEVLKAKVQANLPNVFAKLKEEAKPVYHLKPEPKANAVPVKK